MRAAQASPAVSRLTGRINSLERVLRPRKPSLGTIEYHHPGGGDLEGSGRLLPCDKRDEHGPNCVMSVSPTSGNVRFMRIIHGEE
jgi:hypothetical protein